MAIDYYTYAYAAAVAFGGIMGYAKAGSVPSLATGVTCGALLATSAFQMSSDPRNCGIAMAVSIGLGGFMGYRAYHSGKFMPAGLVAALSLIEIGRLVYRVYQVKV